MQNHGVHPTPVYVPEEGEAVYLEKKKKRTFSLI